MLKGSVREFRASRSGYPIAGLRCNLPLLQTINFDAPGSLRPVVSVPENAEQALLLLFGRGLVDCESIDRFSSAPRS